MEANPRIFLDLTYIFVAAFLGGLLAWRVGLPLIIGYVVGGIVISPFTPGPHLSDLHTFQIFAEVGVVLLMFSIGVEFSISELSKVKWVALAGGSLGIAMSVALSIGAAKLAGWSMTRGIVIGATVSVASTMVLARLLSDTGAINTTYGRVKIGITLFEDLAVVTMTVVLPIFSGGEGDRLSRAAWALGKAFVLLIPLAIVALKIIPPILRKIRKTKDTELFLLVALSICLGTAALAHAAGFSVALGAFLAGLSISGSEDLHDAHSQMIPLRDAFVALFFVSLGTLIRPDVLRDNLPLLGVMLALIVPGKFLVWMIVVKIFRYSIWEAIAVAVGLTQIGELSFVVVEVARGANMVGEEVFTATLAASLISIFINVFLVRLVMAKIGRRVGH
jgi:monovalent cation:H+ antiporter-2, CPA2 family